MFGSLTVDLRQVHFSSATTTVTASVAVGVLKVEVPANAIVYLKTRIGIGPVEYIGQFGYNEQPFTAIPSSLKTLASQLRAPHLVLDAEVGVGQIDVQRGTPGQSQ
jgi:predicted membrane protein